MFFLVADKKNPKRLINVTLSFANVSVYITPV